MIRNSEIRERARISLERRLFGSVWMTLLVCNLLYAAIIGIPNMLSSVITRISPAVGALLGFLFVVATVILQGPLGYGLARMYHKVAKGERVGTVTDLFVGFREDFPDSWLLGFMRTLFIALWSLLLIIPGIVKAYAYSMAFFIQQEAKDKNWRSCLDESADLTYGYKGKLFLLDLSFIGWYLVGLLCLGVGVLWVEVYHAEARAHFYEELKKIKHPETQESASSEETGTLFTESDYFGSSEEEKKDEVKSVFSEFDPADSTKAERKDED